MIELLTADTPNGKKISIMLEEIKFDYKVTTVNIFKDEQFKPEFRKLSPFSKIPIIIDHKNNKKSIFESGAILMYLGEKSKMFYDKNHRTIINQWLMGQMAYVGPMLGQAHQYLFYHPGKSEFAEKKSKDYTRHIYEILNERLSKSNYICEDYSIADIAIWPWTARFERHQINLKNYPNVLRWYLLISKRPAVISGYNIVGDFYEIPTP